MLEGIRDLLRRCEDELESPAEAAVLRSRFRALLTRDPTLPVVSEVIDCLAFVLGAVDAAEEADWAWPADTLLQIGMLAAHHGLEEEAARLGAICFERLPGRTETIALWAETAPTAPDTIDRYVRALEGAADRAAVEAAARGYASHHPDSHELLPRFEAGLSRQRRAKY